MQLQQHCCCSYSCCCCCCHDVTSTPRQLLLAHGDANKTIQKMFDVAGDHPPHTTLSYPFEMLHVAQFTLEFVFYNRVRDVLGSQVLLFWRRAKDRLRRLLLPKGKARKNTIEVWRAALAKQSAAAIASTSSPCSCLCCYFNVIATIARQFGFWCRSGFRFKPFSSFVFYAGLVGIDSDLISNV